MSPLLKNSKCNEEVFKSICGRRGGGMGMESRKSREVSGFSLPDVTVENRFSDRVGFSFCKYHFGSYKENESESHVLLFLPNWPISEV